MCFIKYFYKRIFEPMKKIEGNIIDIYNNRIFPGTICIDQFLSKFHSAWFYRCSCTY